MAATRGDPRNTREWKRLTAQVRREEPVCWLRLPGCTIRTTTADHILTVKARPDLALVRANLRGACLHCNSTRNDKPIESLTVGADPVANALDWFN